MKKKTANPKQRKVMQELWLARSSTPHQRDSIDVFTDKPILVRSGGEKKFWDGDWLFDLRDDDLRSLFALKHFRVWTCRKFRITTERLQ